VNPLDAILKPKSIAIVGASRREGSIGREILHQLVAFDFHGKLFPVNPKADFIHSIKAFPTVSAIPDPVDLAIIVVPREEVLGAVDDCGKKGVPGLVVITSGFSETGEEGKQLEAQLGERVRQYGMRMIGPNCMGVINTGPAIRMDATFAPTLPLPGRIAFMSQSGALGVAILNIARQLDLGFSYFVSLGNKTNVSGNELLEYWEDDADTDLILMYLESFGNAKRFMQICRRISKRKPLLVVKSGRTEAGARAATSHTGALAARQGLDVATGALLEQCGVIRVNTVEELFDLAMAFSKNPLPRGNRLAILTNAGGPAIMATDAAIAHGLSMAEFSERTRRELRRLLPPEGSIQNPVDMTPQSDRSKYDACARILLEDDGIDMLLVVFVPPMMISTMDIILGLEQFRHKYLKPVVGVIMATEEFFVEFNHQHPNHMALYIFPESAVSALAALERYRMWREKPVGELKRFEVRKGAAEELIQEVRRQGRLQLTVEESLRLIGYYGIPVPQSIPVANQEKLERLANELRYPVVLKAAAPDLVHKMDVGGVLVDLRGPEELLAAAQKMVESVARHRAGSQAADSLGFLVQEYVYGGREVILGMTHDRKYGPVVMFGLGGIYVETVTDVVFRLPPLTDLEAHEMIRQIRGYNLLRGVRGEPPVDLDALAEILQRFSQFADDLPEIAEIEINPLLVFPHRPDFCAVDARVRLCGEPNGDV
jgi:acetyltransferase